MRVRAKMHTVLPADAAYDRIAGLDSEWTVPFRGGAIRWRQHSEPAPDQRRIAFTQETGDFQSLSGAWWAIPVPGGSEIHFELAYDVGVPVYDRILGPVLDRVFREMARTIVSRL
jgi:ribosome-associated toxin RatA of RatAB toxin-antitoxin module